MNMDICLYIYLSANCHQVSLVVFIKEQSHPGILLYRLR